MFCSLNQLGTSFCIRMQPRGGLQWSLLHCNYNLKISHALPFSIVLTKSERFIQSFHFSVFFRLMESKHSLIKFIFSTFRRNTVIEEIFWSREDVPITDVLVDTAKIRT